MTKSGTGTWDLGRGTRGRRDVGRGHSGTGDSKTLRLGDVGRKGLEDVINKQHMIFFAEFVKYNFRCSRERYYMLESLSVD